MLDTVRRICLSWFKYFGCLELRLSRMKCSDHPLDWSVLRLGVYREVEGKIFLASTYSTTVNPRFLPSLRVFAVS